MTEKLEVLDQPNLEPGDRQEKLSPFDYCLAAGCGCSGCLDPTGCLTSIGQGCLGCFHSCLAGIGCGVVVIGCLITIVTMAVSALANN